MERIDKVGVELEGGFSEHRFYLYRFGVSKERHMREERGESDPNSSPRANPCWHGDGSVSTPSSFNGEVVSLPHSNLAELEAWILEHYPNHVNDSCGFHIHMSFKSNLDYSRLMSRRFHRYFLKSWETWGKKMDIKSKEFWDRLYEKSTRAKQYCKKSFSDPDKQAVGRGDRYHQLNFCYSKHHTLECRMLPMFQDASIGIRAMRFLVQMTEKWLALQKRENGINFSLEDDEEVAGAKEVFMIDDNDEIERREKICV